MFFWDYDTQWGADRSRSGSGPKDWGKLEFPNTDRLLELHDEYKIPACFAVVGAAALPGKRPYHDPDQIKRINAAGHEIGSHTFHHDWIPALNRLQLKTTLSQSKDALEQCIGTSVTAFVPPYNQPYDFPAKYSFSLSERKQVKKDRTNIPILCATLSECGYTFSRISYRTITERLTQKIQSHSQLKISQVEKIHGVKCLRLNSSGFKNRVVQYIKSNIGKDGYVLIYGHPHSLTADNDQNERHLISLMAEIHYLRVKNKLQIVLPKEL